MEKFDGSDSKWTKWWFDLTVAVGGIDQELERAMEVATDMKKNG